MRRLVTILALFAVGVFVTAAVADNGPPPGFQAAADKCKAQGLSPTSQDFVKCVSTALGITIKPGTGTTPAKPADGTPPPGGSKPASTTPAGQAAQTCAQQGLKQGTQEMAWCVTRALMPAKQQAAWDACVAKGLTPMSNDFRSCMTDQMGSAPKASSAKGQDLIDYCLGKGAKSGSDAFKQCLADAAKAQLPANVQAAVDQCQSQGITDHSAMAKCVNDLLKVKVPATVGTAPGGAPPHAPSAAEIKAAMDTCLGQGLKGGSDAFLACMKQQLGV